MAELNTFNHRDKHVGDGLAALVTAGLGIAAMMVAFALSNVSAIGFAAPVVLAWSLVVVGLVLAVKRGPRRPVGVGLLVAGLALPVGFSAYFWVALSGWVVFG